MSRPAEQLQDRFRYYDYVTWPEGERWELIHGAAYAMSPAPSPTHQRLVVGLVSAIHNALSDSDCQAFVAPFDVRLPDHAEADESIETVVQPDILVICDASKLDANGCKGAPDLIVEILSPSTAGKDRKEKFALYEQHGVKEYWIVYPFEQLIELFTLDAQGRYGQPAVFAGNDRLTSRLFPEVQIELQRVFQPLLT
jgi:Uma2 family endonuclease